MRQQLSSRDGERLEMARAQHIEGRLPEARAVYQTLLKKYPRHPAVESLLGALYVDQGEPGAALPLLQRVSRSRTDNADAHYNLGLALAESGDHEAAVRAYRRAVRCNPSHPKAFYNLGLSYRRMDRQHKAVDALLKDYALKPSFDTCRLLARAYTSLKDFDAALEFAQRCVELEGANLEDLNNLVMLLCHKYARAPVISDEQTGELLALADHALQLEPRNVDALVNAGRAHSQLGDFANALEPLARATQLDPENESAHALYAVALLTEGHIVDGWRERTLLQRMHKSITDTGVPRWQGEARPGLKLWVTREQGVGDQFLYAAMLKDLIDAGVEITLVCESRVMPLIARSMPAVHLSEGLSDDEQRQQDAFATMGELHLHLRGDRHGLPAAAPYLYADPDLTAQLADRYRAAYPGCTITGLAWLSHSDVNGAGKSVPLDDLLPVLTLPGRVFVCAQYGDGWETLQDHAEQHGYRVHLDPDCNALDSLDRGAAQLAALDELVSVSNASVHMAGAMGVRTHVLTGLRPVWHWFSSGSRSPWYADVHLYRQDRLDSWETPVRELAAALTNGRGQTHPVK